MNKEFKLVTVKEAASFLKVSVSTLRRWQMEGRIKYIQYQKWGPIFFDKNSLAEFISSSVRQVSLG